MLFLLLLGKDRMTDRVADVPISSAGVSAMASNAVEPFPQLSFMQLSCFINSSVISFKFPFTVDSERNSFLGYRFDESPDHDPNARFVASASTVIIEDDRGSPSLRASSRPPKSSTSHPLVQRWANSR
jgi:hypothetical protein